MPIANCHAAIRPTTSASEPKDVWGKNMGVRKRVYEIVEPVANGDRAGRIFDISILGRIAGKKWDGSTGIKQ